METVMAAKRKRPEILALQLTKPEKDEFRRAAAKAGLPMSVFTRLLALAAIKRGETVKAA
jgi:hypothetical protein